jgi:hypothetical protein
MIGDSVHIADSGKTVAVWRAAGDDSFTDDPQKDSAPGARNGRGDVRAGSAGQVAHRAP